MMTCREILEAGAVAVICAGCAGAPQSGSQAPGPAVAAPYVPDSSYHLLMAEIALQRQAYLTAAQEYLSVAEQSTDSELARRATEYSFDYGLDAFALRGARRWAELAPEDALAHEYLAILYLRRSDLEQSLYHAERALGPAATRSDENYLALADDLEAEENPTAVTRLLTRLRARDPDSIGLQFALARAALRSGDYDLALVYGRRVAAGSEDSREADLLVARTHVAAGDPDLGLTYLEERLRRSPGLGLELEYVRLLGLAGRSLLAIEVLDRLAERYGAQPEFLRVRALVNYSDGDLDAAETDFDELLTNGSSVYECFYYLGRISALRERPREATRYFSRIEGGPYHVAAQIEIARAQTELGDLQAALDHLVGFAANYPRHAYALIDAKADLLQRMGRHDDAVKVYDDALRYKPDSIRLLVAKGAALETAGRVDEAIESMERAVALAPANAMALNSLGYTLANRTRRHREAYRHIRLAIELEPDSPPIIDSMGWVEYRAGRIDSARTWLELAYDRLADPEIAAHLGEVLWVAGEREAARSVWQEAVAEFPDSEPLTSTMARFLR